ncbi:hypothetical protein BH10CYA1_BH10CYA1_61660 [soil metagenome]
MDRGKSLSRLLRFIAPALLSICLLPSSVQAAESVWLLKQDCATVGKTVIYLGAKATKIEFSNTGITVLLQPSQNMVWVCNVKTKKMFKRPLSGWHPCLTNRMSFVFGQDLNQRKCQQVSRTELLGQKVTEWISLNARGRNQLLMTQNIDIAPGLVRTIDELTAGTAIAETMAQAKLSFFDGGRGQQLVLNTNEIRKTIVDPDCFTEPHYAIVKSETEVLAPPAVEDLF